ncbi:hypothetical protein V6N11_082303 [Hibiscus sabdariffa]|uniref:RNase H type-1 domain-containing protein n=1 Tax=Hibiscus sabdariffa TaxID=183260 RepID=A0ABR2AHG8_9ROSI
MSNPFENLGVEFSQFPDAHGGRPPDIVFDPANPALACNGLLALERHGSLLPTEDDARLGDHYDTTMEDGEDINPLGGVESQAGQGDGQPKPSFRDTLIGKNGSKVFNNNGSRFAILQNQEEIDLDATQVDSRTAPHSPLESRIRPSASLPRGKEPVVVSTISAGGSKTISQSAGLVNSTSPRELPMDLDVDTDRSVREEDVELEMGHMKEVVSTYVVTITGYKFPKERSGRVLLASLRGRGSKTQAKMAIKGGRIGAKVKKKDDQGSSKLALEPHMAALVSKLDEAEAAKVDLRKGNQGGDVQWCENVIDGLCWHIHDGNRTNFWNDKWLDGESNLASTYAGSVNPLPVKVACIVDTNGGWDWNRLNRWLPHDKLEAVAAVKPPQPSSGADIPGWRWERNQGFSVRSAYRALEDSTSVDNTKISNFFSLPFPDWLLQCVSSGGSFGSSDERWAARFTTICWLIWKQRCNADFDNISSNGIAWVRYGNQIVDGFSATHDRGNIIGRSNNNSVDDLLELMNRSWKVQLRHISRIQNVVVDKLVALSRDKDMGEIVWVNPPEEVLDALHHDMTGILV